MYINVIIYIWGLHTYSLYRYSCLQSLRSIIRPDSPTAARYKTRQRRKPSTYNINTNIDFYFENFFHPFFIIVFFFFTARKRADIILCVRICAKGDFNDGSRPR